MVNVEKFQTTMSFNNNVNFTVKGKDVRENKQSEEKELACGLNQ